MKIVVLALIRSIGPLLNLIIFTFIIFLIFALMGMNLLSERMGFCLDNYSQIGYGISKTKVFSIFILKMVNLYE